MRYTTWWHQCLIYKVRMISDEPNLHPHHCYGSQVEDADRKTTERCRHLMAQAQNTKYISYHTFYHATFSISSLVHRDFLNVICCEKKFIHSEMKSPSSVREVLCTVRIWLVFPHPLELQRLKHWSLMLL